MANEHENPVNYTFQFTAMLLSSALEDTLLELAAFHDNRPGPWLDELQDRFEANAKTSFTEGLSIEGEKVMIDGALAILRMAMDAIRNQLSGQSPGNNDIP